MALLRTFSGSPGSPPASPFRRWRVPGPSLRLSLRLPVHALLLGVLLLPAHPLAGAGGAGEGTPRGTPTAETAHPAVADTLPVTFPADTWSDPGVRALLARAREAREAQLEGLESYQARVWERMYVGLDARAFRRERGLFAEERAGFLRWAASGERWVRWEGARRDIPIAGVTSAASEEQARQLANQLATGSLPFGLAFEPGSDRIVFGASDWALHPLADTAGLHYRYHAGDTVRITLPTDGRRVELVEVRVEPRRSDFRLLAASLWFENESGALARAVYRPARPFDLGVDGDGDGDTDIPRLLRPIRAEIRVVSVDHGLFEFQWWIPRRFLFEGEATVGRLARFPLSVEWTLSELDVNQPVPASLSGEDLPPGWRAESSMRALPGTEGDSAQVMRIVPPAETLATSGGVGPPVRLDRPSFLGGELAELEDRLGSLFPAPGLGRLEWERGLEGGLTRFNRVEGFATGVGARTYLPGGRAVRGYLRVGTHALLPTAGLELRSGTVRRSQVVTLQHELRGASDWHDPTSFGSSVMNLVNGEGPTPWYRVAGGAWRLERSAARWRSEVGLFAEAHRPVEAETRFHLRRWVDASRTVPPNFQAQAGEWAGLRGDLRWQSGLDPSSVRLLGRVGGEAGAGSGSYGRGSVTTALLLPLFPGWDAALEAGGGGSVGDLPVQRRFFPGGASGFRPVRVGEREGEGYLLGRAELARGFPGARILAFADLLATWHGSADATPVPLAPLPREGWGPTGVGAGVGVSLLDGLFRADLVREIRPEGGWRVLFYMDGLF